MKFKYDIGQAVEYKPTGKGVGLFKVIRQMPEEHTASDRRYRIRSDREGFERNVMECDLDNATQPPESYDQVRILMR